MMMTVANMQMEELLDKSDAEMEDTSGDKKVQQVTLIPSPNQTTSSSKIFNFATAGHSLAAKEKKEQNDALSSDLQAKEISFDKRKTKVVCQLTNNRKRITLNADHTILDLYQHIKVLMKQEGPFEVLNMGNTPPTTLDNPEQTVEDAKLNRSRIKMQPL